MKRFSRQFILLGSIAAVLAAQAAHAATLYWDINGTTANTSVPLSGIWDGTNVFWNDASTGTGGTPQAGTTNADDLIFSSGSIYTFGTVTLSGARIASSITFEDNNAVSLSGGTSLTLGGSGAKSGIFVLAGNNQSTTISTPIILDSGTSALAFSNAGTGSLTIGTGTLTGSATGTQTINLTSTGTGGIALTGNIGNGGGGGTVALNKTGSGGTTLTGTNTFTGNVTLTAGTLSVGASANLGGTNSLIFDGGRLQVTGTSLTSFGNHTPIFTATKTVALDINDSSNIFTVSQALNQTTGGLTKTGNGTLVLTGANTYTGTTSISGGILQSGSNSALDSTSSIVVNNYSTLAVNYGGAADYTQAQVAALLGKTTFGTVAAFGFDTTNAAGAVTYGNVLSMAGGVTKLGAGTLLLNQTNTYTGATTVFAGVLLAGSTQAFGSNSAVFLGNGTLDLGGNSNSIGSLNGGGANSFVQSSGGAATLTTGGGNYYGVIQDGTGTLSLTKTGTGELGLYGANTFSGGVVVNGGTLVLGSPNALGTGPLNILSGSLSVNYVANLVNANNNPVTVNGDFIFANSYSSLNLGTGAISLGTAPGTTRTISADISSLLTLGGVISNGATADSLTKDGSGTLFLSGNNTYSGTTTVSAGTLVLSGANTTTGATAVAGGALVARHASALGGNANASAVTLNNAALNYAAAADAPLAIGGTLGVTGGADTIIGGSIGAGATSARISVAGAATISDAEHKVNVYGIAGVTPGTGTYTLLQGGAGSALNPATAPTLNLVYNNTNFTVGALTRDADHLYVDITSATPLATAYWTGAFAGAPTVWAASDGSAQSNWVAASGGPDQPLVPGATTDLVISYSDYGSTLGADMNIRSLTVQDIGSLQLIRDGSTLTITPANAAAGIMYNSIAGDLRIDSNIVLGAAQSWTNNGLGFSVNGTVTNGGNLLTIGGTGQTNLAGAISGSGGLTVAGGYLVASGGNTYTGTTTINGGYLDLRDTINASAAITLSNNGRLGFSNNTALGDSAGITSHGGSLYYANTSSSGAVYAETTGTLALANGWTNVVLGNDMSGGAGNMQTLTLSGLTRTGTATASFSAPSGGPNATTNRIKVTGAVQTPAGQIIGPWATTATGGYPSLADYAVYDGAGHILPAGIAASTENLWASGSDVTLNGASTLTATRTLNSLRYTGSTDTLDLAGNNLETLGILNGGTGTLTINSTGGVVRQPGTAAANLYVTTGNGGPITVTAPIQDNTGALTLVMGNGGLTLSGANTFSGGVVLNAGTLNLGSPTALGTGPLNISGGTLASSVANLVNTNNNPVTVNGDFALVGTENLNLGTGAVSLGTAPGTTRTISAYNTGTIGGVISDGTTANSLTLAGYGTLVLAGANTYTGTTTVVTGVLRLDSANALPGGIGSTGGTSKLILTGDIIFGGGSVLGLGHGDFSRGLGTGPTQVEFTGSSGFAAFTANRNVNLGGAGAGVTWGSGSFVPTYQTLILGDYTADATVTFQNPINLGADTQMVEVRDGSAAIDARLTGALTSSGGGGLYKFGYGTLSLEGANTYTGTTTVLDGMLRLGSANALPGGIGSTGGTSNLTLNGVLGLGSGDFSRGLGTGPTQVQISGSSGFAAFTANRNVNLGGAGAGVTWGTGSFVPQDLILGAATADATVTFQNPINLGGAVRTVQVEDGSAAIDAKLTGALTSSAGGGLLKTGTGTLNLDSATQSYNILTASAGTTNVNGTLGTLPGLAVVTVSPNAQLKFGTASQTLSSLSIGAGATVTFTSGPASFADSGDGKAPGLTADLTGSTAVPEPGTLGLLLTGALGVLGRRRRETGK